MSSTSENLESIRKPHVNSIWLVPLIALLVAMWMLYDHYSKLGPVITLTVDDADGLEAGKTKIKARSVDIGEVTAIRLTDDLHSAIITVQMDDGTQDMLTDKTEFWVVKPRIGKAGISGLGTLLSGVFINMAPSSEGASKRNFEILKQPPLSTAESEGIRIRLYSREHSKMEVATPVHFRGYEVGFIESVDFDIERSAITYQLFIRAPFDALVDSNVQFWMTPGLSVRGSADGVEISLDSLESLVSGGISFGPVLDNAVTHPVEDLSEFRLFSSEEEARDNHHTKYLSYVMLFNGSVRGLNPGAPLELNGIRLGTVEEVPFSGATLDTIRNFDRPVVPVLVRIEPQRLENSLSGDPLSLGEWQDLLKGAFAHGMRATLSSSNLLSGAKLVKLHIVENAQPVNDDEYLGYPIFPTTGDSLASMQQKVETLLTTLAELPLQQTVTDLNATLEASEQALNELHKVGGELRNLMSLESTQQLPESLNQSLNELRTTLSGYQSNGVVGTQLQRNLSSLQRTLSEMEGLLRELRHQPNSLLFGREPSDDIQPEAANKGE